MNGAIVKSTFLTLAIYSIFFSKGYSIGDDIQIGARGILPLNSSGAIIFPISVFLCTVAIIESIRLRSAMYVSIPACIAVMLFLIVYYKILVTYLFSRWFLVFDYEK